MLWKDLKSRVNLASIYYFWTGNYYVLLKVVFLILYSHIIYVAEMSQFYVPQKSQNQNLVSIRANKK